MQEAAGIGIMLEVGHHKSSYRHSIFQVAADDPLGGNGLTSYIEM